MAFSIAILPMKTLAKKLTLLFIGLAAVVQAGAQGSGGINAPEQRDKPYLILVSLDGFRWDYPMRYDTPALDRIIANGIQAESLVPVFPTLTFPNHYSIATGLYPANHGLVGNRFPSNDRSRFYSLRDRSAVEDGRWYSGEPIWVAAERNGMVSAAFFFVGTEAPIHGIRPTHWNSFNAQIAGARRVDQVLEWLALPEERRPHMITLYFEDVDSTTHSEGVGAPLMVQAVRRVDGYLDRLLTGIDALPFADQIYLFVVSDHGLSNYRRDVDPFIVSEVVDLTGVRAVEHGSAVFLFFDEPDPVRAAAMANRINQNWDRGQAVVPGQAPSSWHVPANAGFADVIVQADARVAVRAQPGGFPSSVGDHGWAPGFPEMHGIFIAMGPRLPKGERVHRIDAVDIYPLMLEILGLPQNGEIDGNPAKLVPLLSAW